MTIGWTAKLIFFSQSLGFSCPIQLVLNGVLLIKLPTCLLSVLSSGLYISLQKHKWAENTFPIFHTTRQHVFSFSLQSHPTHPYLAACSVLWEACFGVCISCEPSRCWLVWFNQREDDGMGLRSRVLASLCSGLWDSRADGAFSLQGLFPTVKLQSEVTLFTATALLLFSSGLQWQWLPMATLRHFSNSH